MKDDSDERLDRLFALARSEQPDTTAQQEHFETRLMARLRERQQMSAPWYLMAWRMIPAFAVIAVICAVCSVAFNPSSYSDPFAAISSGQEDLLAQSYLTGE
jgi:hypothetical protein